MNPSDLASIIGKLEEAAKDSYALQLTMSEQDTLIAAARSYLIAREAIEELQRIPKGLPLYKLVEWEKSGKLSERVVKVARDALKEIDTLLS
jgi:hypothetical protein